MNPYEVLGLKEGATSQEIKDAYRKLVKQYHPDRYKDNPLADLAEEKMREINEAYDILTNSSSGSSSHSSSSRRSYSGNDAVNFAAIRQALNARNIMQAESMLRNCHIKNAEYYFLYGVLCQQKGFYNEAANNVNRACQMDPGNMEYRQFAANLNNVTSNFRNSSYNRGYGTRGGMDTCDMCQCLICSDCCCECLGGDLISCC